MKRINEIFNPSKITISGKIRIVDTNSGKYVIKEKNKDMKSLYEYLDSRSFNNYPRIIDEYDDNYVYEFLRDIKTPINQKADDMALLLASLHNKTSFFKPVVKDDLKAVYEDVFTNIAFFENKMEDMFLMAEGEEYPSPSNYLLLRNQTRILSLIKYLKSEIEVWYKLIVDNTKERVVYCHNNLNIDHFIDNSFISWDNYIIDSPILDLVNLYQNDFGKYDYSNFFTTYLNKFELLEEEKKLLFIVISIPKMFYYSNDEINNTVLVGKMIDYIDNTEKLIRPYYSVENPK